MFGKSNSIKKIALQSDEEKQYVLKLNAHQMLGPKWIYYRKIKKGGTGLKIFREGSLMEQMKATRSALRFTTKTARKLYISTYQSCLKEIKKFTGLKEGFPELPEATEGESLPSLSSEFDAVIISWTPIKFLLPALQLRGKGQATQRHTEGLVAKLYFKVAGFYAVPENWDRYKLNLYLRPIKKSTPYQEVVTILEPLKKDLASFIEAYEPFKFGKASLSKDVATDADAFDDAMSVESFESQITTLYWYYFIYAGIELFLFRYYLTLITSTASKDAILYLTSLFEPVLSKAIENKNIFLGSFEIDRTKRAFRVPFRKLVKKKSEESLIKKIKTRQGIYETYVYNLPLLEMNAIDYELVSVPKEDSEWWRFTKSFILNIDRPSLQSMREPAPQTETVDQRSEEAKAKRAKEKEILDKEKNELEKIKKRLLEEKKRLEEREKEVKTGDKNDRVIVEEERANLLKKELKFDRELQKLKEKYRSLEAQLIAAERPKREGKTDTLSQIDNIEELIEEEKEIETLPIREFVLVNIMTTIINCIHFKRQARYKIMERFKERVTNDQELEEKRIQEIQKKADKKLRELHRKKSKMDRMKQDETSEIVSSDIERFKGGVEQRIENIKKESRLELKAQKERLNALFKEISKEKSLDMGYVPKLILKLIGEIDQTRAFLEDFNAFVSSSLKNEYTSELDPFYKNVFNILDLSIDEKMLIIQSLEKMGGESGISLSLNEDEKRQMSSVTDKKKESIETLVPGIFDCKVIFLTTLVKVEDLFKLSLDNRSLNNLLLLKITSTKTAQNFNLKGDAIKALIEFNKMVNPLPKNSILQVGREKDKNPEKRLNQSMLTALLEQYLKK